MIGFLRGEILENAEGKVLVLTGGVGYQVTTPITADYDALLPGKAVDLFIHTHVREDALDLYGFVSRLEKDIFLTLLNVNGIGPKVAIGILSKVDPRQLIQAILDEDKQSLTQIPGIGKKTAERVVIELGDVVRKKVESGSLLSLGFGVGASRGNRSAKLLQSVTGAAPSGANAVLNDARAALVGLGYREQDVVTLLNRVIAEMETPPQKAEELVKSALRQLM